MYDENINDFKIHSKMARLGKLLQQEHTRMIREGYLTADPSRGQGKILAVLKIKDGISIKDLSYILDVKSSSLNEVLVRLEKSGCIYRKPSCVDKRQVLVYLTDKGRSENFFCKKPVSLFSGFSDEEKEDFIGYLDRIIDELQRRNSPCGSDVRRERLEEILGKDVSCLSIPFDLN